MEINNIKYPIISVIVPIYKVEAYLPQCIESLLSQTYDNLEIILVDDGSPDKCPTICDEYASKSKLIRVIHKENGGLVSARKSGLLSATGDYVCYVDGDDWVANNHFANVANAIKKHNADIVIHGYVVFSGKYAPMPFDNVKCGYYNRNSIEKEILPIMLSKPPFYRPGLAPCVWGKAFKRDFLIPIQLSVPEVITIGEDAVVSYPALMKAESVEVIDDCGYIYRLNSSSMTRTYDQRLTNNLSVLVRYLSESIHQDSNTILLENQLRDYICFMTLGTISNEFKGSSDLHQAMKKLRVVVEDPIIRTAINCPAAPFKVKFAFHIAEKNNVFFAYILKKIWER